MSEFIALPNRPPPPPPPRTLDADVVVQMFDQSPVSSVFNRIGDITAQAEDYAAFYAPLGSGELPAGGNTGQALLKLSNNDFDVGWGDLGAVDSVFGRTGVVTALVGDYSAFYALIAQALPTGGTTGQVLTKHSNSNYDATWNNPTVAGVASFNTRTGSVVPIAGDYSAFYSPLGSQLPVGGSTGQILIKNSATNYDAGWATSPVAPVASVFTRTGAVTAQSGDYNISQITGANATNWDTAFTERHQWDGGATNLVAATGRTSLGGTTVGQNIFLIPNPGFVSFPRINADNTVSARTTGQVASDIGAITDILQGNTLIVDPVTGNDGTGLRGSSVKTFATIAGAIAKCLSGDIIYVRPGNFPQVSALVVPANVTIVGSGAGVTIITGALIGVSRCLVELSNNAGISDCSIQSTSNPGAAIGIGSSSTASTNCTISNCIISATTNGLYINKSGTSGWNLFNCTISTLQDCVFVGTTPGVIGLFQCDLISDGTTTVASRGVNCTNGTVTFSGGSITVGNSTTENGCALATGATGTIILDSIELSMTPSGTTNYDLKVVLPGFIGVNDVFRSDGAALTVVGTLTELSRYQLHDAQLDSLSALSYTGNALKLIRVNAGETGFELASGGGIGNVISVGTPVNGQLAQWTDATHIQGLTGPTGTIVGTTDTQTLTNKRITDRVVAGAASTASQSPNGDTTDIWSINGLTLNLTIGAPTGTPTDGQRLIMKFLDNGVSHTLTWNAAYSFALVPAPTATVINTWLYASFRYNSSDTKWYCLATTVPSTGGGGGTPGGLNTQLQYNNSGAFGGVSGATSNGTILTLTSPSITTPTGIVKGDVGLSNVTNDAQIKASDFPGSTSDGNLVLFNGSSGKSVKSAAGTGIVVITTGTATTITQPSGTVVGTSDTQTLTNKRITRRALSTAGPGATPTINTDNYDVVHYTAVAANITSMTTNLSGSPLEGDQLRIDFTDDGTARTIAWGATFENGASNLPAVTTPSVRMDVVLFWNTVTSKWRCMAANAAVGAVMAPSVNYTVPNGNSYYVPYRLDVSSATVTVEAGAVLVVD